MEGQSSPDVGNLRKNAQFFGRMSLKSFQPFGTEFIFGLECQRFIFLERFITFCQSDTTRFTHSRCWKVEKMKSAARKNEKCLRLLRYQIYVMEIQESHNLIGCDSATTYSHDLHSCNGNFKF